MTHNEPDIICFKVFERSALQAASIERLPALCSTENAQEAQDFADEISGVVYKTWTRTEGPKTIITKSKIYHIGKRKK